MAASTDEATAALRAAGIQLGPSQLATEGLSVSRATVGLTTDDLRIAVQKAQSQAPKPSVNALIIANETQLKAVRFGLEQSLQTQLQTFLPAQRTPVRRGTTATFRSTFAQGQASGLQVGGETRYAGVPSEVTDSYSRYERVGTASIRAIEAEAARGRQALLELKVPESQIQALESFGTRIRSIALRQAAIQQDIQQTAYNRQKYIAERQLGELAGLAGRTGEITTTPATYEHPFQRGFGPGGVQAKAAETAEVTNIGLLQREQQLLGRKTQALQLQSQLLGLQSGQLQQQSSEIGYQANQLQLAQSQRQINFQRAAAGFVAPGTTPEERAARIDEAKIEADYAQKQLDFQKDQQNIAGEQLSINRQQLATPAAGLCAGAGLLRQSDRFAGSTERAVLSGRSRTRSMRSRKQFNSIAGRPAAISGGHRQALAEEQQVLARERLQAQMKMPRRTGSRQGPVCAGSVRPDRRVRSRYSHEGEHGIHTDCRGVRGLDWGV